MSRALLICFALVNLVACNLTMATETAVIAPTAGASERLVVAWVDGGHLMVWQTGDTIARRVASGGVVQPYIAPDGTYIAYTRGAQNQAETLWLVDTDGTAEQELIGERPTGYQAGLNQIGDVVWGDARTIYFNTLRQQHPIFIPQNDLYRIDMTTRDVTQLLPADEGGRLFISPNRQQLATVYHGHYGVDDGIIRHLTLPPIDDPLPLLSFVGVATASEYHFYPHVHWLPDNETLLVAIPDADLIYDELHAPDDLPDTQLWQIPSQRPTARERIGTVRASFFGLPRWSHDGSALIYAQRTGNSNQFTSYIATRDGSDSRLLFSGDVNTTPIPQWIADSDYYVYSQPTPDARRNYYLASWETEPRLIGDEPFYQLRFVSPQAYVAIAQGSGRLDLRYQAPEQAAHYIGSLNAIPLWDARLIQME